MNIPQIDTTRLLIKSPFNSDEMIRLYIQVLLNPNLNDKFKIDELRRRNEYVQLKFNEPITESLNDLTRRARLIPILADVQISQVREPDTIRVSNLASNCSKELLHLYFSNEKYAGGDVKSVKYFHFENKALIQFDNYEQIEKLLARKHVICDREVLLEKFYDFIENEYDDVEVKTSSQTNDSLDRTKLIVSNINENVSIQQIDFLIRMITNKQEISNIDWSLTFTNKLLITFAKEINLDKVFELFNKFNNLNTKKLVLETVKKTNKLIILVKNATNSNPTNDNSDYKPEQIPVTRDLLELYFTNKLRSGSNGYRNIERISSTYWTVELASHESIQSILTREHILDHKPFYLYPYYASFGLPYLPDLTQFKLKLKDSKLKYICECSDLLLILNDLLSETNSKINKCTQEAVYLEYVNKVRTSVPYTERIWRLKCKQTLDYFLRHYKYDELNLTSNQWRLVNKKLNLNDLEHLVEFKKLDSHQVYTKVVDLEKEQFTFQIILCGLNENVNAMCSYVRDLICKVYFNLSNEQKLIGLVTYLKECQDHIRDWTSNNNSKLDEKTKESRMHTLNEMLSQLESNHLKIEIEFNKLFDNDDYTDDDEEEEDLDYDPVKANSERLRVKFKLNDLKKRINLLKQSLL